MIDLILYRIRIGRSFIKYKSIKSSKIKIHSLLLRNIVKFGTRIYIFLLKLCLISIFSCGILLKDCYKTPSLTLFIDEKSRYVAITFITITFIAFYPGTPTNSTNNKSNQRSTINFPYMNDKVLEIILYLDMMSLLSFLALAIINPSMKNPGPRCKNLSIMYQNVQGL